MLQEFRIRLICQKKVSGNHWANKSLHTCQNVDPIIFLDFSLNHPPTIKVLLDVMSAKQMIYKTKDNSITASNVDMIYAKSVMQSKSIKLKYRSKTHIYMKRFSCQAHIFKLYVAKRVLFRVAKEL